MARAATGGRYPVGGRRRSCRRLLPIIFAVAALIPGPALAADSNADAWDEALEAQRVHAAAIVEASVALADGGDQEDVLELRRRVGAAVQAMDGLDVRACFRVWWSYVRTSFVMYDLAIVGLQASDVAGVRSAMAASAFLSTMASRTSVDCTRARDALSRSSSIGPRGGSPLAVAVANSG
jgi:hypothetical protein